MDVTMMVSKIHRAKATQCNLHYEGSLTVDEALLEASGMFAHQQIDVLNINNGQRFTTYVIVGARGSGVIGVNGAAARLCQNGDMVIICAYGSMPREAALYFKPTVVFVDGDNRLACKVEAERTANV